MGVTWFIENRGSNSFIAIIVFKYGLDFILALTRLEVNLGFKETNLGTNILLLLILRQEH